MYEYESKELDREKLEYLRKNTFLGPIAMFKIARAKKQVDDFRKWYQQREGELLEADYTIADELEYELRFNAFQNGLGKQILLQKNHWNTEIISLKINMKIILLIM